MRYSHTYVSIMALIAVLSVTAVSAQAAGCCLGTVASAVQQEVPAPPSLAATDAAAYWTATGSVVVVGFVTNLSVEPVTDVQITASLLDRNRNDIAATPAALVPRVLPPGARAPWRVEIPHAPWQQGARAVARAVRVESDRRESRTPELRTEAVSVQENAPGYTSRLTGRVVNDGADVATNIRVLAALIAIDGRPVAVDETRLVVDELGPGQSEPFEIEFRLGSLPRIAGYVVYPEATIRP